MAPPHPAAAAGPGSHSEQAPHCHNVLCTIIDVALNICSFDTTNAHNDGMSMMSPTRGECSVQGCNERGQRQQQQAPRQTIPQKFLDNPRPMSRSFGSGGSHTSSLFRRDTSHSNSNLFHRQETVILPHLRFNTCSTSISTLQHFHALFLADNAPHSFQLFHESYGDENVVVTPWKTKKQQHSTNNHNSIIYEEEGEELKGLGESQRTITYQTKISPGSSSNPLVSSPSSTVSSTAAPSNIIPLGVTIVQTLIKNSNMTWVLHCQFSFDFPNSSSSPLASSSSSSASSTNTTKNNNSHSGSATATSVMGKKLLGSGGGLSQYFMSHVVKGSTVNVSIIMTECDEHDAWTNALINHAVVDASSTTTTTTTKTTSSNHQHHPSSQKSYREDIFSCFSHPLLLPPDGLCGSTSSSWRTSSMCNFSNNCINTEEPSKIGASLLSAIKAKNAPSATDFSSSSKTVADVSLAMTPLVRSSNSGEEMPSDSNASSVKRRGGTQRPRREQQEEDVLAYCSSRGYMKVKSIPSELSRAPSTISMRRMILDKTGTATTSAAATTTSPSRSHNIMLLNANADGVTTSCSANAVPIHGGTSSSCSSKFSRGISMRIQMELVDSSSTNSSSPLPSSRSASFTTIDDKIRRGLKKRFARSWVSWAESWCMRVWEEEEAERLRKRALGVAVIPDSNKRNKVNVRPNVRRIGYSEGKKNAKEDTTTSASSSSSVSTKDDGWEEMHVKNSPTRKNERWISMEGREDESGVEVECTVAIEQEQQQQKRRLKTVDTNQNKEQQNKKSTVKRTGLLKYRRPIVM